uniref:Putative catalytic domain of cg14945-like protein n=1 Tax=Amblyomma triste TaxID=251400 RepID=A0A023G3N0_AMBTT
MRAVVILVVLTQYLYMCDQMQEVPKSGVYLSVSSVSNLFNYGQFEVNWHGIPSKYFGRTYVALLRKKTASKWETLDTQLVTQANGKHITSVDAPEFPLDVLMKGQCLGYSAALLRRTGKQYMIMLLSCFSARPTWMIKHCSLFSRLKITDMLIPGTHNSGMYNLGYAHPHEKLYLYNQDQTIERQLAYGIRGFDLRVQYYDDQFYVTHDTVRGWVTIKKVLQDVSWFVNATGELVFLDFHRFTTGFDKTDENKRHVGLQKLIAEELNEVLLDNTAKWKTIRDIFGDCTKGSVSKRRVIVFYSGPITPDYRQYLSLPVQQKWPNAQDTDGLKAYLESKACVRQPSDVIGIMAELTPSFPKFILGNRVGAELVNYMVTEFFRRNYDHCRGIIYTDFFLGNGIIEVAVEANVVIACQSGVWQKEECDRYFKQKRILK